MLATCIDNFLNDEFISVKEYGMIQYIASIVPCSIFYFHQDDVRGTLGTLKDHILSRIGEEFRQGGRYSGYFFVLGG